MLCKVNVFLAYSMLVYALACAYYLVRTRNAGTPFNDTLTEEQRVVKAASAAVRRRAFFEGIVLFAVLAFAVKPFKTC